MKTVFDNGGYIGYYADILNLPKVSNLITSGLVMHVDAGKTASYPGSGTTWTDLTANVTSGELVGSPTFNSANGGFLAFNGNNYARFPNSTALDTQTPTVEVWVKPNDVNQAGFFFEKGALNSQYSLFLYSGYLYWRMNCSGITDLTPTVTAVGLNTTQWHHLAATYAAGTGRRIYANGALVASDGLASTVNISNGGMSMGAYGGYSGGRSYYYNGGLAVCRIYNRALSLAEVQQNYNEEKTRFGR